MIPRLNDVQRFVSIFVHRDYILAWLKYKEFVKRVVVRVNRMINNDLNLQIDVIQRYEGRSSERIQSDIIPMFVDE